MSESSLLASLKSEQRSFRSRTKFCYVLDTKSTFSLFLIEFLSYLVGIPQCLG